MSVFPAILLHCWHSQLFTSKWSKRIRICAEKCVGRGHKLAHKCTKYRILVPMCRAHRSDNSFACILIDTIFIGDLTAITGTLSTIGSHCTWTNEKGFVSLANEGQKDYILRISMTFCVRYSWSRPMRPNEMQNAMKLTENAFSTWFSVKMGFMTKGVIRIIQTRASARIRENERVNSWSNDSWIWKQSLFLLELESFVQNALSSSVGSQQSLRCSYTNRARNWLLLHFSTRCVFFRVKFHSVATRGQITIIRIPRTINELLERIKRVLRARLGLTQLNKAKQNTPSGNGFFRRLAFDRLHFATCSTQTHSCLFWPVALAPKQ